MENTNLDFAKTLADYEKRIAQLEQLINSAPRVPKQEKPLSAKEFLLEKKPSGDVAKTLVICYYLEFLQGVNPFTSKDVEQGFRDAKEPVPAKLSDKLYKNAVAGYIMESKEKINGQKAWTFTNRGQQSIEQKGE